MESFFYELCTIFCSSATLIGTSFSAIYSTKVPNGTELTKSVCKYVSVAKCESVERFAYSAA